MALGFEIPAKGIVNLIPVWASAGAPSNGASGTFANTALGGDLLADTVGKVLYQNTGTSASPTWTALGSSSAPVQSVAGQTGAVIFGSSVVAGAAAGTITVTGLPATATLVSVIGYVGAGTTVTDVVDQTANFSITGANTITGTGSTTGSKLHVLWAS